MRRETAALTKSKSTAESTRSIEKPKKRADKEAAQVQQKLRELRTGNGNKISTILNRANRFNGSAATTNTVHAIPATSVKPLRPSQISKRDRRPAREGSFDNFISELSALSDVARSNVRRRLGHIEMEENTLQRTLRIGDDLDRVLKGDDSPSSFSQFPYGIIEEEF